MMNVDFEGSNTTFTKPANMTDEQCSDARGYMGIDVDGAQFTLLAFKPNKEDIEAILAGRPIMLKLCMQGLVPVCLYTFDENYMPNV